MKVGSGFRGLLVLAAAVIAALGMFWALDAVMYPWAVSLTSPTLPGHWHGEVITPTGHKRWLAIELRADDSGRHGNLKTLGASAQLCTAQGMREYDGFTKPENWRGTQFNLTLVATDPRPEGLGFIRLSGHWDRENIIRADARLEASGSQTVAVERGVAITRMGAYPDTRSPLSLTLRRAQARDSAASCAHLNSQRRRS